MDQDVSKAMVQNMAAYKAAVEELNEAEYRAKLHVQAVRDKADQDIQPLRDRIEELKSNITYVLNTYNGGEKFKVPGLGTAYLSTRTSTRIVDEDALVKAFVRDGVDTSGMYARVLDRKAAMDALKAAMDETGEVPKGVEVQTKTTLSFRG